MNKVLGLLTIVSGAMLLLGHGHVGSLLGLARHALRVFG
jgi:hypothetical protein